MVLEPVGVIGLLTRAGHSAIYLSNVCPDRSPITLRLCHAGERGGVVSKYTPISENEDYDWAIVPLDQFLNGFESQALAPLIGSRQLAAAIQAYSFGPLFSSVLSGAPGQALPDGEWRATLATRFERGIYNFSIATTMADDRKIVEAFNSAENKSRFNFFYRNCSNQTKALFNLILPEQDAIGDRVGGLTMEVPKGLAKTLVARAREHPELELHVEHFAQLPGTFGRSREVLFPLENTYRNPSFAPYWYFWGFSEFALGAMFYHQLLSPFSLVDSMRDFVSPRAAQLTLAERRLRQHEDEGRVKLMSARPAGDDVLELERAAARTAHALHDVEAEKRIEIQRILGSKQQWRAYEVEFRSTAHEIGRQGMFPESVKDWLLRADSDGQLSHRLLAYFETDADFYVDPIGRGPWLRLRLSNGESQSTGVSESYLLTGSPRLAFLVLAAVIDYNLSQSEERREPVDYMNRMFGLLRQATALLLAPSPERPTESPRRPVSNSTDVSRGRAPCWSGERRFAHTIGACHVEQE